MTLKVLDPDKIVDTISQLHARINARFPDSGLGRVCLVLKDIGVNAKKRSEWIGRPVLWIRALVVLGCLLFVLTAGAITWLIFSPLFHGGKFLDILTHVEVEINLMIVIGAATLFLWTLENRYKRWRALQAIHELRSVAHVIDMHQLTKDPDRMLADFHPTESSPQLKMTTQELRRYLDYCSEMLSLTGKIAALYVQKFDDPVALAAASEVESTTSGLSRKIWQKLFILHTLDTKT